MEETSGINSIINRFQVDMSIIVEALLPFIMNETRDNKRQGNRIVC